MLFSGLNFGKAGSFLWLLDVECEGSGGGVFGAAIREQEFDPESFFHAIPQGPFA